MEDKESWVVFMYERGPSCDLIGSPLIHLTYIHLVYFQGTMSGTNKSQEERLKSTFVTGTDWEVLFYLDDWGRLLEVIFGQELEG